MMSPASGLRRVREFCLDGLPFGVRLGCGGVGFRVKKLGELQGVKNPKRQGALAPAAKAGVCSRTVKGLTT